VGYPNFSGSRIGNRCEKVWPIGVIGNHQGKFCWSDPWVASCQTKAALDVLVDTRRRLYGILADGRDGER